MEFEIELQNDNEMIFQDGNIRRRIVVKDMQLWVPKLQLSPEGRKLVNERYLKPTQWKFLNPNGK